MLKGRQLLINELASDHIGEMLLGSDRLEKQQAIWDMRSGELYMHCSLFHLTAK